MECQILIGQGAKHNLLLDSPLIAGSNSTLLREKIMVPFGAVLTPLLSNAPMPIVQPSFVRASAGYLLAPGYGRQSWQQARRLFRTKNSLTGKPIIACISPIDANDAFKLAQVVGGWEQIEGIALYLMESQTSGDLEEIVKAISSGTDLPLLVRLPFIDPISYARVCSDFTVAALIVAAPPHGEALVEDEKVLGGDLHSPALLPVYASLIRQLRNITDLPIIARADAGSTQDVLTLVAAGAEAVILEGMMWVQPSIGEEIRSDLDEMAQRWQVVNWQEFTQRLRQIVVLPCSDQNA